VSKLTVKRPHENVIEHIGEAFCAQRIRSTRNEGVDCVKVIDSFLKQLCSVVRVVVNNGSHQVQAPECPGKAQRMGPRPQVSQRVEAVLISESNQSFSDLNILRGLAT
jgi:hypothetical protein